MKKEMFNTMSKQELIKLIKTELTITYLTTDDRRFIDESRAIIHESELEEKRNKDRRWEKMIVDIAEVVLEVLQKERWGIFFKSEPMQVLPVKESATTLFKVNEVTKEVLAESLKKHINNLQNKESEWEKHQAKNQNPTDNESLSGTETTSNDTEE